MLLILVYTKIYKIDPKIPEVYWSFYIWESTKSTDVQMEVAEVEIILADFSMFGYFWGVQDIWYL